MVSKTQSPVRPGFAEEVVWGKESPRAGGSWRQQTDSLLISNEAVGGAVDSAVQMQQGLAFSLGL